jgi:hypothetical protein
MDEKKGLRSGLGIKKSYGHLHDQWKTSRAWLAMVTKVLLTHRTERAIAPSQR